MRLPHVHRALAPLLLASPLAGAAENEGYTGYFRSQKGDPGSAVYKTANTNTAPGFALPEDPDVFLNATVDVESIRVDVANLIAKVNVDAKVLDLLHFSAGVDASIEHVGLRIDDVYARAELEARLGNVVRMVNDVLGSIDLNPLVAAVGKNAEKLVGSATGALGNTTQAILGGGGESAGSPDAGPGGGAGGAATPSGGAPGQQNMPPQGAGGGGQQSTPPQAAGPQKAPPQGTQENPPQQGGSGSGQQTSPPRGTGRKNPWTEAPHGSNRVAHPVEARDPNILWFNPVPSTGGGEYDTLLQNGDIARFSCDAQGNNIKQGVWGPYSRYMSYAGISQTVKNERGEWERAFKYTNTINGLTRVCWLYKNQAGSVVRTAVEPFDWSQVHDGT